MVKTYIRAPNWSTAPPPKGPLELGHLLTSVEEFIPINPKDIVLITNENPRDVKEGLKWNLRRAKDGELGVFAKFLALAGIGLDASIKYENEQTTELEFQMFETLSFNPTQDYIRQVAELSAAKSHLQGGRRSTPLYLVTGIKVGHGGKMTTSEAKTRGATLEFGVSPPEFPAEIGPKGTVNSTVSSGVSYAGSSSFIVAFQVRKLKWRKGRLSHEMFLNKAELHEDKQVDSPEDETQWELEDSENISALDFEQFSEIWKDQGAEDGSTEQIKWVVPVKEEEE